MARKQPEERTQPTFEQRLKRLEEIVAKLEGGDVGLDESLRLYAEGAGLIKECRKVLAEAEKKIALLTEDAAGKLSLEPFQPEQAAGDEEDEEA